MNETATLDPSNIIFGCYSSNELCPDCQTPVSVIPYVPQNTQQSSIFIPRDTFDDIIDVQCLYQPVEARLYTFKLLWLWQNTVITNASESLLKFSTYHSVGEGSLLRFQLKCLNGKSYKFMFKVGGLTSNGVYIDGLTTNLEFHQNPLPETTSSTTSTTITFPPLPDLKSEIFVERYTDGDVIHAHRMPCYRFNNAYIRQKGICKCAESKPHFHFKMVDGVEIYGCYSTDEICPGCTELKMSSNNGFTHQVIVPPFNQSHNQGRCTGVDKAIMGVQTVIGYWTPFEVTLNGKQNSSPQIVHLLVPLDWGSFIDFQVGCHNNSSNNYFFKLQGTFWYTEGETNRTLDTYAIFPTKTTPKEPSTTVNTNMTTTATTVTAKELTAKTINTTSTTAPTSTSATTNTTKILEISTTTTTARPIPDSNNQTSSSSSSSCTVNSNEKHLKMFLVSLVVLWYHCFAAC